MTRQTWTAVLTAVFFVSLAAGIALIPVPYVTWTPGSTTDTLGVFGEEPVVAISGSPTHPTTGRLDLTTVGVTKVDSRLSLPEAVAAYWLPRRDALPREWIYPEGVSAEQVVMMEKTQMEAAQEVAKAAGLEAAGVQVVRMPRIASVHPEGPADGYLEPGDLVIAINNMPLTKTEDLGPRLRAQQPGALVSLRVYRNRETLEIPLVFASRPEQPDEPWAGITIGVGYRYEPTVSIEVGDRLGGPSAGLVLALAIYDKLTPGGLLGELHVAGTGTLTDRGLVGRIGGVQQKLAAAEEAGADAFLVPAANCEDLSGVRTDLTLVAVSTLDEAIHNLTALSQPGGEGRVRAC